MEEMKRRSWQFVWAKNSDPNVQRVCTIRKGGGEGLFVRIHHSDEMLIGTRGWWAFNSSQV